MKKTTLTQNLRVAFSFGLFQFAMPILGWVLAYYFVDYIKSFDHWIAFGLLAFIGINMIFESRKKEKDTCSLGVDPTKGIKLLVYSLATSIDAMAAGAALSFVNKDIILPASVAGLATFILSFLGIKSGAKIGNKFGGIVEVIGGLVLISIGFKILLEHLL